MHDQGAPYRRPRAPRGQGPAAPRTSPGPGGRGRSHFPAQGIQGGNFPPCPPSGLQPPNPRPLQGTLPRGGCTEPGAGLRGLLRIRSPGGDGMGKPTPSHPRASAPLFGLGRECSLRKDQLEGKGEQRTRLNLLIKISANYLVTFWSL